MSRRHEREGYPKRPLGLRWSCEVGRDWLLRGCVWAMPDHPVDPLEAWRDTLRATHALVLAQLRDLPDGHPEMRAALARFVEVQAEVRARRAQEHERPQRLQAYYRGQPLMPAGYLLRSVLA